MNQLNRKVFVAALLFCLMAVTGCKSLDEKKNIIGIWQLYSINANGMEIGDGKGYIKFLEDGYNETRTGPGLYEMGTWELIPGKEIVLSDETSGAHYQYKMSEDSLLMTMNIPGHVTTFRMYKVDKYPVYPPDEGVSMDYFK